MIAVVSPYPSDSQRGNSVSARRIASLLVDLGLEARVWELDEFTREGRPEDDLIVLHARRSRSAIEAHARRRKPSSHLILVLPGSDLHRDLDLGGDSEKTVLDSMKKATALVVAQEGSAAFVPDQFQKKLRVIQKSVNLPSPSADITLPEDFFRVLHLAHLRPVKEPQLLGAALAELPSESRIRVDHYGVAEHEDLGRWARELTADPNSRYAWRGPVERGQVPALLASSHLSINVSSVEGGANAIAESLVSGVPVIVSDIPANLGMVGPKYEGVFPSQDKEALVELLQRVETDSAFLASLQRSAHVLGERFTPANEREAWGDLLEDRSSI